MDKTIHKKLTAKHIDAHAAPAMAHSGGDMLTGLKQEMRILHEAAKEMMQPRQQAVSKLLEMARSIN